MNLRSLVYSGAVLAATVGAPLSAFAVPGNPLSGTGQTFNNTIQERAGFGTDRASLPTIIGNIINIALGFLGILLLVYLVYAGFLWMTAGGEEKNTTKAKSMIQNAIIGLVIIVSSFAISSFVLSQLPAVTRST